MRQRRLDSLAAEAAFRERLTQLGATLLEPEWLGNKKGHHVRCKAGHDCYPNPNSIRQGQGPCRTCAGNDSSAAEVAFRERLTQLGAELLEPEWLGSKAPHRTRCASGHECYPRPGDIQQGRGPCRICAGNDRATTEAAFRDRLAELGVTLLEQAYLGCRVPHRARCAAGHDCWPRPGNLARGEGACRACAGRDPVQAEARFRARLAELGATPLFEEWLGKDKPHHARCVAGHDCYPVPSGVRDGGGPCKTCAGHDPADAERRFRARLLELGATLLEYRWLGANAKHHIRCAAGHDVHQRPMRLLAGGGLCRACAGRDPVTAEAKFRARVEALGGVILYETWRGAGQPHHIRCRSGHDAYPRPGCVNYGQGICWACSGTDPVAAETAFRARVVELGGTPLFGKWLGNKAPTLIRCPVGHEISPRPNDVLNGSGLCHFCAGGEWDCFYLVASADAVKFGITSDDPRPRLAAHKRAGFTEVIRLMVGLPGTAAPDAERAVLAALAMAGEKPVKGREYFDRSCLALVLDVADSWLTAPVKAESDAAAATVWLQDELFAA